MRQNGWRRAALMMPLVMAAALRAADHGVDKPMDENPKLPEIPRIPTFHPRLKGLWAQALDRPEPGLRIQALSAIATARRLGMPGLEELAPRALALLKDDKQDPAIRLAAARTLAALDARNAAADLLARDRAGDLETALVTDPALARWNTPAAGDLWLARVRDPSTSDQMLRSAMRSLGAINAQDATESLAAILADTKRSSSERAAAAEALSAIGSSQCVSMARALMKSKALEDRLLAALVLPAGSGAAEPLVALAQDSEPGVAAVAVEKLLAAAPDALARIVKALANHPDSIVRRHAVTVLEKHPETANIVLLGQLLNDKAPKVRAAARESMITLDADASLRDKVRQTATDRLNSGEWRALEQAALVLGSVHDTSAKDRCIALLRHEQPQVRVAAVIALRRLKLPETLPVELKRAQELAAEYLEKSEVKGKGRAPNSEFVDMDNELSQLNQNLGDGKFAEAGAFLRKFIPKNSGWGSDARAAAIWSLGMLNNDQTSLQLAMALMGRLTDNNQLNPEASSVRVMSAISLARMNDKGAKGAFTRTIPEASGVLAEACEWGLAYLDGKPYAGPQPSEIVTSDWFLEPAE